LYTLDDASCCGDPDLACVAPVIAMDKVAVDEHLRERAEYTAQLRLSGLLTTRNLSKDCGPEPKQRKSGYGRSGTHLANKGPRISKLVRRFEAMASGSPGAKIPAQGDKYPSVMPQLAQRRMAGSFPMTSPAPALAVVASVTKLGGQDSLASASDTGQQGPNLNEEVRTLLKLEDTSICEFAWYSSVTSCASPGHLSVLPSLTAYLDPVLVSTLLRTGTITHLEPLEVGDATPYRLWEREGIGTRARKYFHRRGRTTTH
jgi:hypothetical protein